MRLSILLSLLASATAIQPISFRDYYARNKEVVDEQVATGRLNLDEKNLTALDGLQDVPEISALYSLMLGGNRLTKIPASIISLPQLEYWQIEDNPITILYALSEIRKRDSFKISIYTPEVIRAKSLINKEACSVITDEGDAMACSLEEAFAKAAQSRKKISVVWNVYINWGEYRSAAEQEANRPALIARLNKVIDLVQKTKAFTGKQVDIRINFGLSSGNSQGPSIEQEMYRRTLQAFMYERLSLRK